MISLSSLVALFANAEMHVLVRDGAELIRRPVDFREWAPGEVVSLVVEELEAIAPAPKVDGWSMVVVSDDAVRYDRATRFLCSIDGTDETLTADSPEEAADAYARGGDWDRDVTQHIVVDVTPVDADDDAIGEEENYLITIQPIAPRCPAGTHDWQSPHAIVGGLVENPGVWGHGGGVKTLEICMVCGCSRRTDTWAQSHQTGAQGLTSIAYTAGEFRDKVTALVSTSFTIAYTIHTADILSLGYTTDEIDAYEVNLEAALTAAYPDADVTVEQIKRVSGGTEIRVEADDARNVEAAVREIASRTLLAS